MHCPCVWETGTQTVLISHAGWNLSQAQYPTLEPFLFWGLGVTLWWVKQILSTPNQLKLLFN